MAKLYVEIEAHGNNRKAKKADDTRLTVVVHHKNKIVGELDIFQVPVNDTINVMWKYPGRGALREIDLLSESIPNF